MSESCDLFWTIKCVGLWNVLMYISWGQALKSLHSFQLYCLQCFFWKSNTVLWGNTGKHVEWSPRKTEVPDWEPPPSSQLTVSSGKYVSESFRPPAIPSPHLMPHETELFRSECPAQISDPENIEQIKWLLLSITELSFQRSPSASSSGQMPIPCAPVTHCCLPTIALVPRLNYLLLISTCYCAACKNSFI